MKKLTLAIAALGLAIAPTASIAGEDPGGPLPPVSEQDTLFALQLWCSLGMNVACELLKERLKNPPSETEDAPTGE